MVMPLGQKSLDKIINNNDPFDITTAQIQRMVQMLKASVGLGIDNNDIKPGNMVMTTDGAKIIDIGSGASPGYSGTPGLKMLHSLLEVLTKKSFKGGTEFFRNYFQHGVNFRREKVASDAYLKYFFQYYCSHNNLSNNCDAIDDFDKTFALLSQAQLRGYAQQFNNYQDQAYHTTGNTEGTHDYQWLFGTTLPYPQLLDVTAINYDDYWQQRTALVTKFCEFVIDSQTDKRSIHHFFWQFFGTTTYVNRCKMDPSTKSPFLLADFTSSTQQEFKTFVMDAFKPQVAYQTFQMIANTDNRKQIFGFILDKESALLGLDPQKTAALRGLLAY